MLDTSYWNQYYEIGGSETVIAELSEARKRANKKWDDAHKELKKKYQYRSMAKSFVRNLADEEDLLELQAMIAEKLKEDK